MTALHGLRTRVVDDLRALSPTLSWTEPEIDRHIVWALNELSRPPGFAPGPRSIPAAALGPLSPEVERLVATGAGAHAALELASAPPARADAVDSAEAERLGAWGRARLTAFRQLLAQFTVSSVAEFSGHRSRSGEQASGGMRARVQR